jgi:hypothetical protein
MTRIALQDKKYEDIRTHILDPDNSPLTPEQADLLDRLVSASKILDKNPIQRYAAAIHNCKYPEISRKQAYIDLQYAAKLFNTYYTFDFDFWHTWLINDIVENINRCRNSKTSLDRRIIAVEHTNLAKVIGAKPEDLPDPMRNEKHQYYILIQNNHKEIKVDINQLQDIPIADLKEINKSIFAGNQISDEDAIEIMNT